MSIQAADALMGIFGMKRVKQKKCKHCKAVFTPSKPIQTVCSIACAVAMAKKKRENIEKAADRQKRESLKSRSQWLREAQTAFNAYIRVRDEKEPCISCGRHHQGQYHAGHYLSTGARPELRFEPLNVHKQCQPCNTHLHGNLILYRVNLIKKIGLEKVEWLEGHHEPKHYSIDDLKQLIAKYREHTRELTNG